MNVGRSIDPQFQAVQRRMASKVLKQKAYTKEQAKFIFVPYNSLLFLTHAKLQKTNAY